MTVSTDMQKILAFIQYFRETGLLYGYLLAVDRVQSADDLPLLSQCENTAVSYFKKISVFIQYTYPKKNDKCEI